jgi:hypothetical protein
MHFSRCVIIGRSYAGFVVTHVERPDGRVNVIRVDVHSTLERARAAAERWAKCRCPIEDHTGQPIVPLEETLYVPGPLSTSRV